VTGKFLDVTISPIDEVCRLHVFIEAWMSDRDVPGNGWSEFGRSLAPDFQMVTPAGVLVDREQVLAGFGSARGAKQGVKIEIRRPVELHRAGRLGVVRYEEWQLHHSAANQRVSTVVLLEDDDAPSGWSWLALHETSIDEAGER